MDIGLHIDENLNWNVHIDSLIMTLVKYFGIFNQVKDYVSNQLARKLYNAFVYSNISYGIEVYGSCSDTSLERLQVIHNKLLKLLLRLDPYIPARICCIVNWIFWKSKTCIIPLCYYSCMQIYKAIVLLLWKIILLEEIVCITQDKRVT